MLQIFTESFEIEIEKKCGLWSGFAWRTYRKQRKHWCVHRLWFWKLESFSFLNTILEFSSVLKRCWKSQRPWCVVFWIHRIVLWLLVFAREIQRFSSKCASSAHKFVGAWWNDLILYLFYISFFKGIFSKSKKCAKNSARFGCWCLEHNILKSNSCWNNHK